MSDEVEKKDEEQKPECEECKKQIKMRGFYFDRTMKIFTFSMVFFFSVSLFLFDIYPDFGSGFLLVPISICGLFTVILIPTFIVFNVIGANIWYYLDPENSKIEHKHRGKPRQETIKGPYDIPSEKYLHRKVTKTDLKETSELIEITGPIFRLKCGGWFWKYEILNTDCSWKIVQFKNGKITLADPPQNCPSIQLTNMTPREAMREISLHSSATDMHIKAERAASLQPKYNEMAEDYWSAAGERDFLASQMLAVVYWLNRTRNDIRSTVGQGCRERLEAALGLMPEELTSQWTRGLGTEGRAAIKRLTLLDAMIPEMERIVQAEEKRKEAKKKKKATG